MSTLQPFYFGPPQRRLFGTFHPAQGASANAPALLLCYPFGQEAVRAHRLFRVLAERTARKGVHVLRFEYYGTGDSAGSDDETDLQGWIDDIRVANDELLRRAGATRLVWLGARLGAAAAAKATAAAARAPDSLVMWEPIIDGTRYLQTLADGYVDRIAKSYSVRDKAWRAMLALDAIDRARAGIGFAIGDRLMGQLHNLAADGFAAPRAGKCVVVHGPGEAGTVSLAERWRRAGQAVETEVQTYEFDWVDEVARNGALVPPQLLERMDDLVTHSR